MAVYQRSFSAKSIAREKMLNWKKVKRWRALQRKIRQQEIQEIFNWKATLKNFLKLAKKGGLT